MRNRAVPAVASGDLKRSSHRRLDGRRVAILLVASALAACNSFDKPGVGGDSKLVIPTDTRAVSQALTTLPAISGGTLKLSSDDAFAVVSDPDRDRVSVVGLTSEDSSVKHIALNRGDEPGRVDIDAGRA